MCWLGISMALGGWYLWVLRLVMEVGVMEMGVLGVWVAD